MSHNQQTCNCGECLYVRAVRRAEFMASTLNSTPLPVYAGHEEMRGRLRAFTTSEAWLGLTNSTGHDPGDEDGER